jgi:pimeloyl-ACP methyl ester carboxylesterase
MPAPSLECIAKACKKSTMKSCPDPFMHRPAHGCAILLILFCLVSCSWPCRAQTPAQEWQARAVQKYPELAIGGSALNQRFVAAVLERRKADPGFFDNPRWPMTLADQLAGGQTSAVPPAVSAAPPISPSPPQAAVQPAVAMPKPQDPAAGELAAQTVEYDAGMMPKALGLESAKFRWWAPANTQVRGVIVLLAGRGGDSRGLVVDPAWQALAARSQFGLMGSCLVNPKDDLYTFQTDPGGAISDLLNKSVNALLAQAGQKVKDPPLAFWGHSAGGNITQQYLSRHADRAVGAVLVRATGGPGGLASGKEDVPIMIFVGGKDKPDWVASSLAAYETGHRVQADWTLALNPREGHEEGKTRSLAIAHLAAAISLRLPATPSSSIFSSDPIAAAKPVRLNKQNGWLGDPATYDVAPSSEYKGKRQEAIWLLDEATAKAWQAYLRGP